MSEAEARGHRAAVLAAVQQQVDRCRILGSPSTAEVIAAPGADVASGGATVELVGDWPGDAVADALPLRLAGAPHALAFDGAAPAQAHGSEVDGPAGT